MLKNNEVLIIGKIPPPIGGVTIHVKRLMDYLKVKKIPFHFLELSVKSLLFLPLLIHKYKTVHLHTSSIHVQEYVISIVRLFNVNCIVTFHGDLLRYSASKLQKVKKNIKRCTIPIVLNEGSYKLAKKINDRTVKLSAFIPPTELQKLQSDIESIIRTLKDKYQLVYATNAYALTYDKHNQEIYGIIDLIYYFNTRFDMALIISDPSSEYKEYIEREKIKVNKNIYIISKEHSFYEVIKKCDATIRNTSTDGDSLSVKESLYLEKITYATNVVSRPIGVIEYTRGCYDIFLKETNKTKNNFSLDEVEKLIELYSIINI